MSEVVPIRLAGPITPIWRRSRPRYSCAANRMSEGGPEDPTFKGHSKHLTMPTTFLSCRTAAYRAASAAT